MLDSTHSTTTQPPRLLVNEREAAKMLSIHPNTLAGLRKQGKIPAVHFGRAVRYDLRDLREWIEATKQQTARAKG